MRDDLHGGAQVITAPFLADDRLVNPPRREIAVAPAGCRTHEALVMAEVEIRLGAVVRYEYFAMLEWAHRARINVDVRIQLDHADRQAARL